MKITGQLGQKRFARLYLNGKSLGIVAPIVIPVMGRKHK
jgi:hypothetical protein